jgi:hypothetical protein
VKRGKQVPVSCRAVRTRVTAGNNYGYLVDQIAGAVAVGQSLAAVYFFGGRFEIQPYSWCSVQLLASCSQLYWPPPLQHGRLSGSTRSRLFDASKICLWPSGAEELAVDCSGAECAHRSGVKDT